MTLEQIRKMSDDGLNRAVGLAGGYTESGDTIISPQGYAPTSYPDYSRDLNAAMTLVSPLDIREAEVLWDCLDEVIGNTEWESSLDYWMFYCPNKPRALCEAFLLWKGSAT